MCDDTCVFPKCDDTSFYFGIMETFSFLFKKFTICFTQRQNVRDLKIIYLLNKDLKRLMGIYLILFFHQYLKIF